MAAAMSSGGGPRAVSARARPARRAVGSRDRRGRPPRLRPRRGRAGRYAPRAAHGGDRAAVRRRCAPGDVLRHTAAMTLLNAGIDTSTIALWLGHEQERTTHVYLHADLALKQPPLDRITPPDGHPGRYRAPDSVLAFLDSL